MAEGKQSDFVKIKAMDTMEFWTIFDLYCAKIEREKAQYKQHKTPKAK